MVQVNDVWYDVRFEDLDGERGMIIITREGEFKCISLSELFEIVVNENSLNINYEAEHFAELVSAGNSDAIYLLEGYAEGEPFCTALWKNQAEYLWHFGMVAIPVSICIM